jgi:hypothetical protein
MTGSDQSHELDREGTALEATPAREAAVPKWDQWMDTVVVLLLAISSVLAAWSGYQANLWGGEQTAANQEAATRRLESTRSSTIGLQKRQIDIAVAMNWLNAYEGGNTELADFYVSRFSPQLTAAYNAWMATDPLHNPDAAKDPFALPEYQISELTDADRLEAESNQLIVAGQESGGNGDRYVATTVILAIVLFFAGIAPQVKWRPARVALVSFAVLMFAFCLFQITRLPVAPGWERPFEM